MALTRQILLVGALVLTTAGSAAGAEVEHMRTVGSSTAIDVGRALGDVVAIDSSLAIDGVVRGHVFAVDSRITLGARAVVLGSITVNRGRLTIRPGAVLPKMIYLNDAGFLGPNGEAIDFGETLTLADGDTEVSLDKTVVSTVSVELMKVVLPFDRFVPRSGTSIEDLERWHPGLDLELRRSVRRPSEMTMGGIARLSFVSEKVRGAFQRGYRGRSGTVLVSGIQLQDAASAASLWSQLHAAGERAELRLSLKSGLGDGAHWFFKRKDRFCMLWQRSSWLIAVETRLADRDASLFKQLQFSKSVLRSLERQLTQQSALSRGVQR